MDRLLQLLEDHQVGIWCKRAAWILLALNLIRLPLFIYTLLYPFGGTSPQPVSLSFWNNALQTFINVTSTALFDFFLLYAAGVVVDHLVGSVENDEEEEVV